MSDAVTELIEKHATFVDVPRVDAPNPSELLPCEVPGYYDLLYPRLSLEFLRERLPAEIDEGAATRSMWWGRRVVPLPRFAVFDVNSLRFVVNGWMGASPYANRVRSFLLDEYYNDVIQTLRRHRKQLTAYLHTILPRGLRLRVAELLKDKANRVWVVPEMSREAWALEDAPMGDPLVVLVRETQTWLIGWYDLRSGEAEVLEHCGIAWRDGEDGAK